MRAKNPLPRACRPGAALGLGLVLAGACFLFDPFVSIFDILPDFVGYLLIAAGLYRLGDLDDRLADAARLSRRLAWLGLARVLAMVLAFGFVSGSEKPTFILLALFSIGVLDVMTLIPMLKFLGGGLMYLGARQDATALLDRSRPARGLFGRHHKTEYTYNATERYTAMTTVFLILKEILVVLPETTVLTHERGGAEMGSGTILYDFVGLFRTCGVAVSLVLGVVWLVATLRFFRRVIADKPFMERLRALYIRDVLPRQDLFAKRAVRAALISLTVALAFSASFYLEGVNLIPDIPGALFFGLSLLLIRRYTGRERLAAVAVSVYGVATVVTFLAQFFCFSMGQIPDIKDEPSLASRYTVMLTLIVVTALLFCLAAALVLRAVYRLVLRHTGVAILHEGSSYAKDRNRAIHRELRRKLVAVFVVAVLCAVSWVVHWGVIPTLPDLAAFGGTDSAGERLLILFYNIFREGYWTVDLTLHAVLAGVSIHASSDIFEQMEYSHLMQG